MSDSNFVSTPQGVLERLTFHVKHTATQDLERFTAMVVEQNEVMNLIGPATVPDIWNRHVLDSAQLLNHRPEARTWADLGAGAGFPGVVLAILLKHAQTPLPGSHVFLVDSLAKRCRFLEAVVAELALPASVINGRAEDVDLTVDIVTSRACAPMDKLLGFAENFFKNGAEGWFLKGESVDNELRTASQGWRFDVEQYPSLSDPRGRVVRIRRPSRARKPRR